MTLPRQPAAVVFDMDGLLFDTESIYERAALSAAAELGQDMDAAFFRSTIGVPWLATRERLVELYGPSFAVDELRAVAGRIFNELVEADLPLKPGVVELLDFLASRGLPLGVATSARRPTAENHLGKAGLLGRFAAIATRDDVERTKPHPDVYLEAARRLGVAPERCLAFEDSNVGLEAAHAAGAMAFMVPDLLQPLPENRKRSVDVFPDLHAALRVLRQHL